LATMAGIAERYRKLKDFGDWKEIENYIVAPNLGNTSSRAPREKPTKEAVRKVNQRKAVERCEDKLRANFKPYDKFTTLTFAENPDSKQKAARAYDAFMKRLRRRCDKLGIEVRFCKTIEQGERTGRWHIHAVINDEVPYELIRDCWAKCGNIFVKSLWGDGSGFANVHNLAEYFVGVNKKDKRLDEKIKSERTYSFSSNCVEPVITYEPMSAKWLDVPRVPHGWALVPASLAEYVDAYGLKHQKYIITRLPDDDIPKPARGYRGRLSEADTKQAWELEQSGASRKETAKRFNVCERTLTRSYEHYALGSPLRKKRE